MAVTIKQRGPKKLAVDFTDDDIFAHPISAQRVTEVEGLFPTDMMNGRVLDSTGYMAALLAEIVRDANGKPAMSAAEIKGLDNLAFWQLWEEAGTHAGVKKSNREKIWQGLWDLVDMRFFRAGKNREQHAGELWDQLRAYMEAADRKN